MKTLEKLRLGLFSGFVYVTDEAVARSYQQQNQQQNQQQVQQHSNQQLSLPQEKFNFIFDTKILA